MKEFILASSISSITTRHSVITDSPSSGGIVSPSNNVVSPLKVPEQNPAVPPNNPPSPIPHKLKKTSPAFNIEFIKEQGAFIILFNVAKIPDNVPVTVLMISDMAPLILNTVACIFCMAPLIEDTNANIDARSSLKVSA